MSTATYTVTDPGGEAWEGRTEVRPPTSLVMDAESALSASAKAAISENNDNDWGNVSVMGHVGNIHATLRARIHVPEPVSSVSKLTTRISAVDILAWPSDPEWFIWNHTSAAWESLGDEELWAPDNATSDFTANIGNYIDANGDVHLLLSFGAENVWEDEYDSEGEVVFVAVDVEVTEPDPQLDAPVNLANADIDHESFTASWDAVQDADQYRVQLAGDDSFDPVLEEQIVAAPGTSHAFTDLDPETPYHWRVRAEADGFEESPWTTHEVVTAEEPDGNGNGALPPFGALVLPMVEPMTTPLMQP